MHAIAIIALAMLSLLAGSLIEPPAAKAATRSRAAAPAPVVKIDDKAPYRIVSEDMSVESSRRHVVVVLPRRIAELEIAPIADAVRAKEKAPFEKTVVNFYLPGMKIGQGAWAIAVYNPTIKVSIVGLRLDEEQSAIAEAAADKRAVIGVWLTASPAAPGRLTLYREAARVFAEWRLRDGTKSVEELTEQRGPGGRHFTPASGTTDFYLLTPQGELELRDGHTVIASAERLPGFGEKAAAKVPPVAVRGRASSAKTATASADSGPSLSDKLFKN
jgi:hypothetical protein